MHASKRIPFLAPNAAAAFSEKLQRSHQASRAHDTQCNRPRELTLASRTLYLGGVSGSSLNPLDSDWGHVLGRYLPVVPMVLINGAEGIGTGWSTYIPNYNPREVAANLRRLLRGEELEVMQPWYRGFKGTIQEVPSKTAGKSYNVYGTIAQVCLVDESTTTAPAS